jgi:hypothetical protein
MDLWETAVGLLTELEEMGWGDANPLDITTTDT